MIWDELETYISRKELSNKAISEVCEILESREYLTDEEIDSLVKVLFKLKFRVLYTFMTSGAKILTKQLVDKIVERVDISNTQKSGHIYCLTIALDKTNFKEEANDLLLKFVRTNVGKKIGGQVIDGFRQALQYGYDTFLFSKFEGWTSRDINLYGLLLTKCVEILNDPKFTAAVKACSDKNSEMLGISIKQNNETKQDIEHEVSASEISIPAVQDKDLDTSSLSAIEILNLLKQRFEDEQNTIKIKDSQIINLKSEIASLKAECLDLDCKGKKLSSLYEEEHSKLVDAETNVRKLQQKLAKTETEAGNLREKLSNVLSAYDQAGQNEIDSMKENISRRLGLEYRKYLDIKTKEDAEYYDMLILILDEVFKVLKKNGITL